MTWNFRDTLISRYKENREIKVTWELSDSHYVHNQERTSLLPLERLQITLFY